jgi:hypothetical protein
VIRDGLIGGLRGVLLAWRCLFTCVRMGIEIQGQKRAFIAQNLNLLGHRREWAAHFQSAADCGSGQEKTAEDDDRLGEIKPMTGRDEFRIAHKKDPLQKMMNTRVWGLLSCNGLERSTQFLKMPAKGKFGKSV